MSALKYWDGTQWVINPIAAASPGPPGSPRVGRLLDVQRQWGRSETWQVGHGSNIPIWCNASGTEVMRLTCVPVEDAFWDVSACIGLIHKTNAAYNYRQPYLKLTPNDADGKYLSYQYEMANSTVQTYTFNQLQRTWKLWKGLTYICEAYWYYPAGGTWNVYQGPGQLHMEGLLFSR